MQADSLESPQVGGLHWQHQGRNAALLLHMNASGKAVEL